MQLNSTFKVPVPIDEAWRVLLDYPRLARCMPGATVTEVQGDDVLGQVKVKLGPVAITYQGRVTFAEKDEARHRIVASAAGREVRGSGTASAQITAVLTDAGGVTEVSVSTDLNITGKPAQFGRSVVAEVSERLIGQFAENLARELENGQPAQETQPAPVSAATATVAAAPAAGDSLDLLGLVGGPVLKRLTPVLTVLATLAGVAIVRRLLRGRSLWPPRPPRHRRHRSRRRATGSRSGSTSAPASSPRSASASSTSSGSRACCCSPPWSASRSACLRTRSPTSTGSRSSPQASS
ncbi:MAG TPA: SRPBCC family protein [Trebonia sp.]